VDRVIALVALRWRMELRGFRRTPERVAGMVILAPLLLLSSVFGATVAFVGSRTLAAAEGGLALPVLSGLATVIGLFWMLSPLLSGLSLAETHDVTRLLHFPIPPSALVVSSLVANLVQPLVLAKMPVALGVAAGVVSRPAWLPLSAVGVGLSFVFMLAAVQAMGLLLLGVARNRRFHDLALFFGLGLGFLVSVAPFLVFAAGPAPLRFIHAVAVESDVFALSPFAWGIRAAVHGGRGDLAGFALNATAAAGAIAAAMGVSGLLIHRIYRGEVDLGGAVSGDARPGRMVFAGPIGTLFEKDLRVAWRDPALKAGLFVGLMGPLLFALFFSQAATGGGAGAVLMLSVFVGMSIFGTNTFGMERRGVGLLLSFPVERWRILVAKNAAAMVLRVPGLTMLFVVSAFLAPRLVPSALTSALVGLLFSAAIDNYVSILFPVPAPEPGRPVPNAGGRGLAFLALSGLFMASALALAAPFVFLGWLPVLLGSPWLSVAALPLALAGAVAVYSMLVAGAERLLARRERDVLERILVVEAA
jgi:hypothetical protein